MQKQLIIESLSTPDKAGYNDKIFLSQDEKSIFHCQCSACPNPYRLSDKKPWSDCFGWIACTPKDKPIRWKCESDKKKGKCLILNERGNVPTRNLDVNNNAFYARGCLVHCGYSETWQGSKACITLPPAIWPEFIDKFLFGEQGLLYIIDYSKTILTQPMIPN